MSIQGMGIDPTGTKNPSASAVSPSDSAGSAAFGARRIQVRAGFGFFRRCGHGRLIASLKALYNFTIAGLFSGVSYVLRSADGQPLARPSRLPPVQHDLAQQDIQRACQRELTEHSYRKDQHKGAVMIIEDGGLGYDRHEEGYGLMRRLGIDGVTKRTGAEGCSITLEEGRALPFYQLSPFRERLYEENRDWPLKINNAGACLISIPVKIDSSLKGYILGYIISSIRQLPPGRDGRPDMSKVRFMFTQAEYTYNRIQEGDGSQDDKEIEYAEHINDFKELLRTKLKETFGNHDAYDIPDESFITVGQGEGDYMTPPDKIRAELAKMTASC